MRKNLLYVGTLLYAGCFIASCSNEDEAFANVPVENNSVTIRAGITEDSATRIALGESSNGKTKVLWSAGDAFSLVKNQKNYIFSRAANDIEEKTVADFIYTGTESLPDISTLASYDYFWYPSIREVDYVFQTGKKEDISNYMNMRASIPEGSSWENMNLSFKHLDAIIQISLTEETFKNKDIVVKLHAQGLIESGLPTITSKELTANENGTVTAYFVIPATSSRTLSNCCIYADCGGKRYKTTLTNKTIEKGKLYKVSKNDLIETNEKIQCKLPAGDSFRSTIASKIKSNYNIKKIKFIANSSKSGSSFCTDNTSWAAIVINGEYLEIHTTAEEFVANAYCAYMFSGSSNYSSGALKCLTEIDFNNCFNTENVTNMSGMFYYSRNLTMLDLSCFSFNANPTVSAMFYGIADDITEKPIPICVDESGYIYFTQTTTDCCIYNSAKFVKSDGTDW